MRADMQSLGKIALSCQIISMKYRVVLLCEYWVKTLNNVGGYWFPKVGTHIQHHHKQCKAWNYALVISVVYGHIWFSIEIILANNFEDFWTWHFHQCWISEYLLDV